MSTLLFIHGSGFTGDAFLKQLEAFPGSHAPNLPGHARDGQAATIPEFADFIEQYIAEHALHDVVLCGHSLGGAIALEIGLRKVPAVRALILLGSGSRLRVAPAFLSGLQEHFEQTSAEIAAHLYAEASPEKISFAVDGMAIVGKDQTLRDYLACNSFDLTERLPELLLAVLALVGERDVMTPPKYAQFLADRVPAGEVRIIPGAGHMLMIERPAETNDAIVDFVTRVS